MKKILALVAVCALLLSACSHGPVEEAAPEPTALPEPTVTPEPTVLSEPPEPTVLSEPPEPQEEIIEIREKMFITQTNDIYINPKDYLGKTLKYEGIFKELSWEDAVYYYVIRYGPGCCGYDGEAGFEVVWDQEYPQDDDWVEAIGVLEEYEEGNYKYLRLILSSLQVLPTRGEEYVSQ